MSQHNPYTPGYNVIPPLLAGRDRILQAAAVALDGTPTGRVPPILVLSGPSGVGKTTLQTVLGRRVAAHDWPWVHVEARSSRSLATLLAWECERAGAARAPHEDMVAALRGLAEVAARTDMVALLSIDEAQQLSETELAELDVALRDASIDGARIVTVIAGLPALKRSARKSLRGAQEHDVGLLSDADSLAALSVPARDAGRPFTPRAVELLAERSGGHPYVIQLYGDHAWEASEGCEQIGMSAARKAIAKTDPILRAWLDRMLRRLPAREGEYLSAAAVEQTRRGHTTGTEVAARLGASTRQLSVYRQRLLDRGALVSEHGQMRLCMPDMARRLAERVEQPTVA